MDLPDDMREYNRQVIAEFRANDGVLGPPFSGGSTLLLTTTGRRSRHEHTVPVMFKEHGDALLVIASNAGAPRRPDWYFNLEADPEVVVERGAERFNATARITEGDERSRLWDDLLSTHPFFADHQARASAPIPLVLLEH